MAADLYRLIAMTFIILMGVLSLSSLQRSSSAFDAQFYLFPKFWTNTGLCPAGKIEHDEIKNYLLSDALQMNLLHISALPKGAITNIRIHWLLELLQLQEFTQAGVPLFDFSILDKFLLDLEEINLSPVIEFMANLSNLFVKNPNQNKFYWESLSYQVTKHYLDIFGANKILSWRFETWNEPDVLTYNILNFTVEGSYIPSKTHLQPLSFGKPIYVHYFLTYIQSVHVGLKAAGANLKNGLEIPLRGPAGLLKSLSHHPLCWSILDFCNAQLENCPIKILTYHRKGFGENASDVIANSNLLLTKMYGQYPKLKKLPISNDESDPIAGWSTPRDFQADVRYALTLADIVLEHWSAKLTNTNFDNLESISHDNAFLSYHPHEFSQRTLLAHFRMNMTTPPHSQFIQKPVYSALGIMSRLADLAYDVMKLETSNAERLSLLRTFGLEKCPLYHSWLLVPILDDLQQQMDYINLPLIKISHTIEYSYIIEVIDQAHTNPAKVWFSFNSPPYPNSTVREAMRRQQNPRILDTGILKNDKFSIDLHTLKAPWLLLFRVCSALKPPLGTPHNLVITAVTQNEVYLTWQEMEASAVQCLKTYEVWFRRNDICPWICISSSWHLPFPSFHFAPVSGLSVNGFYKVRGIDIFNNTSFFSGEVQYIEIN